MMDDENAINEFLPKLKASKHDTRNRVDLFESVENNFDTDVGFLNQDQKHLNFDL